MSVNQNKELIEKWYKALAESDFKTIFDMHHEDVVYNMLGSTPVSGRIYGKDACCNGMIGQKLLEKLVPEKVKFSKEWKIIAAEGDRVVGVMKGGALVKMVRTMSKLTVKFLQFVMERLLNSMLFLIQF